MREDKSIESAVFSTLYLDLVQGLRQQRQENKAREKRRKEGRLEGRQEEGVVKGRDEYELMLRAVVADEMVHPLEKSLMAQISEKHAISAEEHAAMLAHVGWTVAEWERGMKDKVKVLRQFNSNNKGTSQAASSPNGRS